MSAFAKLAAEALVTPEQLEADAKRNRWKKWLALAGGAAAAGAGAYGLYSNWDKIAPAIDKFLPGLGTKPGLLERGVRSLTGLSLPWAGAVAGAANSRHLAEAAGLKGALRQKLLDGGEYIAGAKKKLDDLVAPNAPAAVAPGQTPAPAPRPQTIDTVLNDAAAAGKTHPVNMVLDGKLNDGKINLNGTEVDVKALRAGLKDARFKPRGMSNSIGRAGLRGVIGAGLGWGAGKLDQMLTGG